MTDFRACGTIMGPTGLTAVFGMGTGVAPPVWSPGSRPEGVFHPSGRVFVAAEDWGSRISTRLFERASRAGLLGSGPGESITLRCMGWQSISEEIVLAGLG